MRGDQLLRQGAGTLTDQVVVQEEERLRGHHGLIALAGDAGGVHEVEEAADLIRGGRSVAHHWKVDRPFEILRRPRFPMMVVRGIDSCGRESAGVLDDFEGQGGAARFGGEFAADLEKGVANGLGFEALAVHAPEEPVLGVEAEAFGVVGAGESIGVTEDESAEEALL